MLKGKSLQMTMISWPKKTQGLKFLTVSRRFPPYDWKMMDYLLEGHLVREHVDPAIKLILLSLNFCHILQGSFAYGQIDDEY